MKTVLVIACALLLCACSTAPTVSSSFAGQRWTSGPTSANDPRLAHSYFYRDDVDNGWWTHGTPPAR